MVADGLPGGEVSMTDLGLDDGSGVDRRNAEELIKDSGLRAIGITGSLGTSGAPKRPAPSPPPSARAKASAKASAKARAKAPSAKATVSQRLEGLLVPDAPETPETPPAKKQKTQHEDSAAAAGFASDSSGAGDYILRLC